MVHVDVAGVGGVLGDVHAVVLLRVVATGGEDATPQIEAIRRLKDFVEGEFDSRSENGEVGTGIAAHAFAISCTICYEMRWIQECQRAKIAMNRDGNQRERHYSC